MSEDKLDKMFDKISEISERTVRVEVIMKEVANDINDTRRTLRNHEQRINELESHKDSVVGVKDVVAWLAIAGIMVWEVMSK